LRPFVSELRLRQTSADHDRGWWVYLPASNRSEALQLTRQLAEAEVEDYYVVAGGDMENSVSVGLYQSIDNARNRQARIRSLGFDAQMEVRREQHSAVLDRLPGRARRRSALAFHSAGLSRSATHDHPLFQRQAAADDIELIGE
jgi:hypothetical protein